RRRGRGTRRALLAARGMSGSALVEARRLSAHYRVRGTLFGGPAQYIHAVDDVSFDIRRGETLGLVGESGCGKSTLGRALVARRRSAGGSVSFAGQSIYQLTPDAVKALRRQMQIVFQDPFASLDPRKTVGRSVRAALDIHGVGSPADRQQRVEEMFHRVG